MCELLFVFSEELFLANWTLRKHSVNDTLERSNLVSVFK